MENFFSLRTVIWDDGRVKMIDQTLLPGRLVYKSYKTWEEVADAIRRLVVRGAPAIGVAAAMAIAATAANSKARTDEKLHAELEKAASGLSATRPTAVNLFWGIDRVMGVAARTRGVDATRTALVKEVQRMADEDVEACKRLGKFGADFLDDGDTVITQCNAGALATVGYGTALGVLRAAKEQGKEISVIIPETRPALQGSRLTAYELSRDGFSCKIISDTAVGHTMATGKVDKAIVGADRVTKDGFVFNKIGTYQVAVLAARHGIPFYPAAPTSSFDLKRTHDQVTIEERPADEVAKIRGRRIAPKGVPIGNPAFDMTPPELVTAIISDRGVITQPLAEKIPATIR